MKTFNQFLDEAKNQSSINIKDIIKFVENNSDTINEISDSSVDEALAFFNSNKSSKVLIFPGSIAFRLGKGSVKSITEFKSGFKSSVDTSILSSTNLIQSIKRGKLSKPEKVILFMYKAILSDSKRVLTEIDKTENQETEETLRTITELKKLVKANGGGIDIKIGKDFYTIDGFRQISGRPKADMAFTYNGKDVVFVSHKLGKRAGDFQQYGGLSNDLGFLKNSRDSSIVSGNGLSEIQTFLLNVENIALKMGAETKNGMVDFSSLPKGTNFAVALNDETLAATCMYGKNFGSDVGLDNVHVLIDGNIIFEHIEDGKYLLDGSYHLSVNPYLPGGNKVPKSGVYKPMLFVMRSSSQGLNQGGFMNARAVIWPNNKSIQTYVKLYKDRLEGKF